MIAHPFPLMGTKWREKFPPETPYGGVKKGGVTLGWAKNREFRPSDRRISETVLDRVIVTMGCRMSSIEWYQYR